MYLVSGSYTNDCAPEHIPYATFGRIYVGPEWVVNETNPGHPDKDTDSRSVSD